MYEKITPEAAGISSAQVKRFLQLFEQYGMGMHSMILAKGDDIFLEAYWKPIHKDTIHRMYSQTKSYVGIAVCQLAAEGKLSLDDKIIDYFPDKLPEIVHPYLAAQTIRHMLRMETCFSGVYWFAYPGQDRLITYFHQTPERYPGTIYRYDSTGSFVLSALVERVAGKDFLTYLRETCLDEIGFSKEAKCLYSPWDYLWGDSALICSTRDMFYFMRLLARGGEYQGKQLLDPEMVQEATRKQIDNSTHNQRRYNNNGYGYQIWHSAEDTFSFHGMHGQYSIHHRPTNLTLVCTSGLYRDEILIETIFRNFFENIVDIAAKEALPVDKEAYEALETYCEGLELITAHGEKSSPLEKEINGRRFLVENESPTGITEFTLYFEEDGGKLEYVNAQGKKVLSFGKGKNVFQKFPEIGYSKDTGSVKCEGHRYDCAVSAGWEEDKKLLIYVQIIDDYIGLLDITIGFNGEYAVMDLKGDAEDFLEEYIGFAVGVRE